jgi:DNA phosphorothioation-associated putative methyltransferase
MVNLGRVPETHEFSGSPDLIRLNLTPKKLRQWFFEEYGEEVFQRAVQERRDDLLVYLALANFRRRIPFRHLPSRLQADMRTFFGSYQRALEQGRECLFALGREGFLSDLCQEFGQGHLEENALYVHHGLVDELPPALRVYLGCAEVLEGGVGDADIIKIHRRSKKVSLLFHKDFERGAFPELQTRIKINLADQSVQYFDHAADERTQVLCGKHRFVSQRHPKFERWRKVHERVERLIGPSEYPHLDRDELSRRLGEAGYELTLRKSET